MDRAEACGMRPLVARCHLGLGQLFHRVGDLSRAGPHLTTADAMFCEMDMPFWRERAEGTAGS